MTEVTLVKLQGGIEEGKDFREKVPGFREFDQQLEAVSRAGNHDQAVRYAGLGQAHGHSLRLLERHPAIVRPVNEKGGRVVMADMLQG